MRYVVLGGLLLVLAGCGRGPSKEVIVARIDDEVITAREFQLNYEFGYGHLRAGENPRRTYLDFMINEKLLALEAEKIHLDTAQAIVHALQTLREELLIERVFEEKVLSKIEVSEEELRQEINKAAVSFQFRFLPARSEAAARRGYEQVLARGFERVLEDEEDQLAELGLVPADVASPYVNAEDLDPVLVDILKDLDLHTPSQPVPYQGYWYVFEVTDIRRRFLAEEDYQAKAPTYRKILYNRKAMEQGTAFVAATMKPKNVVTRRQGFEILNEALWDWYRRETPVRNLLHYIEDRRWDVPFTRKLVEHYDVPLVAFEDRSWTIRDFLAHFTPGRYVLRRDDPAQFKARLADVVALVVRDDVLLRMAEEERLYEDEHYRRTLTLWKDKWMFQEYLKTRLDSNVITEDDVRAYYVAKDRALEEDLIPFDRLSARDRDRIRAKMTRDRLTRFVDSLAARHRIEVDEAVLDTLQPNLSTKNPRMTVHLFKSNSNKMPFPIVDPNWMGTGDSLPRQSGAAGERADTAARR